MPATPQTPLEQPAASTLRRLPTRIAEPPFDDELASEVTRPHEATQGALALAFALPSGLPAVPTPGTPGVPSLPQPEGSRRLRLVPPLDDPAADQVAQPARMPKASGRRTATKPYRADDFGPLQTPRAHLPQPRPWAARLVQAIVEVTAGARPVGQLVRWTSADVYESMRRRVARAGSRPASRTAPVVRSVHVTEPTDGVAEVCAVVQHGERCQAVAARLEGLDGRWQCTALQVC